MSQLSNSRRKSMISPQASPTKKTSPNQNLLTRRASTGNMPSRPIPQVNAITDDNRRVLKKGIGHLRLSIEGSGFHKWLEYLAHVKFGDLTKKCRFIFQTKYSDKESLTTKDYDNLQEWLFGMCGQSLGRISKKGVRSVLAESTYKVFEEGEPIFYQSQHGSYYMLLLSGKVDIMITENHQRAIETHAFYDHYSWEKHNPTKRLGTTVATLEAGVGFGGVALLSRRPKRSASALATMATEILMVPKNTYLVHLGHLHKAEENIDDRVRFLKEESHFFHSWKVNRLVNLAYGIMEENYSRGSIIERQGDEVSELKLLVKGEVCIYEKRHGENHCVAIKDKGTFFGQMEFVKNKKQQVTVIAHTNCLIYRIPRATYDKLISKNNIDGMETKRKLHDITDMYDKNHHKTMRRIQRTRAKDKPLFQISKSPILPKIKAKGKLEAEWSDYTPPIDESMLTFDSLDEAIKRDDMGFPPRKVPPPRRRQPPWASGEIIGYNKEKTIKKSLLKKERKKLVVRMSKKSPTRKKSKKIVVRQFEAPSILAKTLELMETKFSQNNPTIRNALQRK